MIENDQEMLRRMLAGDEGAFTALYRLRQASIYRFALQMTGSIGIAEDVTQETFLAILTQGKRFDPTRGTLAAFLYGIARNMVMRSIGKPREELSDDHPCGEDLLGDLTRRETVDQVRRAALSLPPAYRETVVLCDMGRA